MSAREITWQVALGLVVFAIGAMIPRIVRWARALFGELSGCWIEITYKEDGAGASDDHVWFADVVRLRHSGDQLRGTMWRLFPNEKRAWKLEGRVVGDTIVATYTAKKGGGLGLLTLLRVETGRFKGRFIEPYTADHGAGITKDIKQSVVEWVERDECQGEAFRTHLEALPSVGKLDYPRSIRAKLLGRRAWRQLESRTDAAASVGLTRGDIVAPPP